MSSAVVVLSGGGAKAAAHAGAVRALDEAGIAPSRFIATSMGAVVAAGLAAGLPPAEIVRRLATAGPASIRRRRFLLARGLGAPSLLQPKPLREAIAALLPARRFSELRVPLTCTAVDIDSGERLVFGHGGDDIPLVDALVASCALPMYYPPVEWRGRRLADGGLRGVLPLDLAPVTGVPMVIAVDIGSGFGGRRGEPAARTLLGMHDAATGILMADGTALRLAAWRADPARPRLIYVRPDVEANTTFAVDRSEAFAALGHAAMRAALADGAAGRDG